MVLVSLYDIKAKTWTPPHVTENRDTAIREFATLVNSDRDTLVATHPEDYSIYLVGEWFDRVPVDGEDHNFKAKLVAYQAFEHVANGIDLVKKDKPNG